MWNGGVFQTRNGDGSSKSAIWYAKYYRDGKPVCKSTGKLVKAEAEQVLRDWLTARDKGLPTTAETSTITYDNLRDALLDSYREKGHKSLQVTADGNETIFPLPPLDAFFSGKKVSAITPDLIRAFKKQRQADGVGNAAINNSLSLLRRMFSIARHEGKLPVVPFVELLPAPPARQGFVKPEQFEKLLAALPDHLHPLIMFVYFCGGRVGEALELEWSQVDLKSATVTFRAEQTKTSEARTVPLPDRLVDLLRVVKVKSGHVFDGTNLRESWYRACVDVRLGELIPVEGNTDATQYRGLRTHDLRRSALNNLRKGGVPPITAMRFSGHRTLSTFVRYNIVDEAELHDAKRKVEALISAPRGTRKALPPRQKSA